jgi:YYY domain-containing protein
MEYGRVLVWLVAYAGLAALAYPATAALFARFPRRGAGFAIPVALATLGVVGFWVGRVGFGYVALLAGLLVLGGLSAAAAYRGVELDRRGYVETVVVFSVAFLFLVGVRALDPAVHPGGGEKFLDFGLLSSLARSPRLPPEDIWFAGEPVRYYYGGHMIASLVGRLTFTPPRYSYNLALSGFFGALVTAAYALAGGIAADRGLSRRSAGLFAAFLVGFASNLVPPTRLLVWLLGPDVRSTLAELDPGDGGVDDILAGGLAGGPGRFEYWSASRVIEGTINEFPFFAYLNGDLHAHMMNMAFVLLVAGVLYTYWKTPSSALRRRRAIVFGVVPVLAGLVAVVNTWSFPTVLGLAWLGVVFAPAPPSDLLGGVGIRDRLLGSGDVRADGVGGGSGGGGGRGGGGPVDRSRARAVVRPGHERVAVDREILRTVAALVVAGVVAALAVGFVVPYFNGATSGRQIAFVSNRSSIPGLVLVHGVFLGVTARFLLPRADPGAGSRLQAIALVGAFGVLGHLAGLLGVVVVGLFVLVGWVLLRTGSDVGYETALALGALGIIVLAEFVYVGGRGNPTRYNTVFKTYADVWILWGTAVAVILAEYADPVGVLERLRADGSVVWGSDHSRVPGVPVSVGGVLAAVLVVSLSLYAGFAMANHVSAGVDRGPATVDSLRFVERQHATEAGAIEFVRELDGQPNIVTAPTIRMYQWSPDRVIRGSTDGSGEPVGGSAPASLTGVPTLAGWVHEIGYRGRAAWDARVQAVRTIYDGSPSEQVRQLRTDRVEYIYVGPAERHRYRHTDLVARLAGVSVAYEDEYVTIYRVDRERLDVDGSDRVVSVTNVNESTGR